MSKYNRVCKGVTIDQAYLKQHFFYEVLTGHFIRRTSSGSAKVGDIAGTYDGPGYRKIRLFGKWYKVHRLAFMYMLNRWPVAEVDHINRVKDDNRWINLREADRGLNTVNVGPRKDSKTGIKGVSLCKISNKYKAYINSRGKRYYLGTFNTLEEAASIRMCAEMTYWRLYE